MIDKININPIRYDDSSPGEVKPRHTAMAGKQQGDAVLQVNFDRLMEQARKVPADDTEIIHRAQELLRSGQLDTAANIKEAAQNIINYGI